MAETAAYLVDHVIPEVPVRQWVLSLPIPMRYWLSSNPKLLTQVLKKIIRVIDGYYKNKAKTMGIEKPRTGAITFLQRFGSGVEPTIGGGGEIRTHEGLSPLPVFKTGAINHSATPPDIGAASPSTGST